MQYLASLDEIVHQYKVFFVDVIGVVHNGVMPYEGAITTLNSLINDQDKQVIFLSNNPRPGAQTLAKLVSFGVDKNMQVFTSGDATRYSLVNAYRKQKIYHLGANRNNEITKGLALDFVEHVQDSEIVLLTAFLEPYEDIDHYQADLDYIIANKLRVLCANPDLQAFHGQDIRRCAGYIAQYLRTNGVNVEYLGKPNKSIYENSCHQFSLHKNDSMLMIGDTLETDVLGAANFGIDSLLVMTGNTGLEVLQKKVNLDTMLANQAIKPTYVLDSL